MSMWQQVNASISDQKINSAILHSLLHSTIWVTLIHSLVYDYYSACDTELIIMSCIQKYHTNKEEPKMYA
jgi:hypothetical protein